LRNLERDRRSNEYWRWWRVDKQWRLDDYEWQWWVDGRYRLNANRLRYAGTRLENRE
jgi:hypothetical protein